MCDPLIVTHDVPAQPPTPSASTSLVPKSVPEPVMRKNKVKVDGLDSSFDEVRQCE